MRIIIQRVNKAKVTSNEVVTGEIGKGMMVLVGLGKGDEANDEILKKYAKKLLKVRLWPEILEPQEVNLEDGMEEIEAPKRPRAWRSNVVQNGYGILVVSQFTLYGFFKGNKPDFHGAMKADMALEMYNRFVEILREEYEAEKIQIGAFGQYMEIDMQCDGPMTMTLDSEN